MIREQRGDVSIGAHSETDEVKLGAVVDLGHTDDTGPHKLSDDEFVVISSLLSRYRVIDGVYMARNNGNLKITSILPLAQLREVQQ